MVFAFLLTALAAAPARADEAVYTVRPGDNLTLIAQRFGVDVGAVRQRNDLAGDLIRVGQTLHLGVPFGRGGQAPAWRHPVERTGPVLRPFGPYKAGGILMPRTGVELACAVGSRLLAPAHGVVRFSGVMEGYGHLIILEHAARWATVLGPCDPDHVAVTAGQAVLAGDELGRTGPPPVDGDEPYVHLELRHRDEAVAPDRLHR
ncbi:LysM peptidoglycan-binding domain-containing M23 family metallopeptidase [bacterium]|nr:LysM peptidoglycan-binding domain-containing M23 family metallopeptidase [bacterium]